MIVYILLTTAGADTGPFNLYSDVDGYISAFETGVSKAALLAGYTSFVAPPGTTIVRVKSDGVCTSQVDINVTQCTTTSTTTQAPLMFLLGYSLTAPDEACGDDTPATTYAAPGSILQNGTILYTNPSLTIFVPDGYYSDGVNVWYASSGVLTLQSPCTTTTTSSTTAIPPTPQFIDIYGTDDAVTGTGDFILYVSVNGNIPTAIWDTSIDGAWILTNCLLRINNYPGNNPPLLVGDTLTFTTNINCRMNGQNTGGACPNPSSGNTTSFTTSPIVNGANSVFLTLKTDTIPPPP